MTTFRRGFSLSMKFFGLQHGFGFLQVAFDTFHVVVKLLYALFLKNLFANLTAHLSRRLVSVGFGFLSVVGKRFHCSISVFISVIQDLFNTSHVFVVSFFFFYPNVLSAFLPTLHHSSHVVQSASGCYFSITAHGNTKNTDKTKKSSQILYVILGRMKLWIRKVFACFLNTLLNFLSRLPVLTRNVGFGLRQKLFLRLFVFANLLF